jgi:DNA (cytosine-5)-methyltransferase 1
LKPYVSIFSGGGIGDTGFRKAGLTPIILNELDEARAALAQLNFPEAEVIVGDVNEKISEIENLCNERLKKLGVGELFLLSATPPCQGMSKNGIGTILKAMRDGKRPKLDERNYLFKAALQLVGKLRPQYFFFENVDRMANTYILDDSQNKVLLVDYMSHILNSLGYIGEFRLVNFADYGLPQNRRRMVGIFARNDTFASRLGLELFPKPTHSKYPDLFHKPYVTVEEAIGHLPELDSVSPQTAQSDYHPLHKVPVSRPDLYYWIQHTAEGDTAFNNNRCPKCGHVSAKSEVLCEKCGNILPKPVVYDGGKPRLINGFVSAYKRMKRSEPAPTITTRSAYACSDHNLHPTQNRVLSLLEVAILQGLDVNEYKWGPIQKKNKRGGIRVQDIANDMLIRDVLGEPVSPIFSHAVGKHLIELETKSLVPTL